MNQPMMRITLVLALAIGLESAHSQIADAPAPHPGVDFVLDRSKTHTKFSSTIPPAISVPSGSVIEAYTHEATGGQLTIESTTEELAALDMDRIHTLSGPVYVEDAMPGDVLAVTLLEIEPGNWGWMGIIPGFGLLADEFPDPLLSTFPLDQVIEFAPGIRIPLSPFAGVMGVAPASNELLNTIPPRANGGNMDDPSLVAGTTVYFPVFVKGALFSIGDTHAVQGYGEVSGTAVEAPMRIIYRVRVVKGGLPMQEPQYETDAYYATTGFAATLDDAVKNATRYMMDYLVYTHGLSRQQAYMLCSIAGDLKIAEVVDAPNKLVTMHMPKSIFTEKP
jgi:acetamidase/formamidase